MKLNNQNYAFLLITLSTALTSVLAQRPLRTLSTIDAEIVCICGEASLPYAERVRLIHRLPSNLTPEQLERCRAFLESPLAGQPLSDLEFNGLKNELVFALLRQREGLTELAELLVRHAPKRRTPHGGTTAYSFLASATRALMTQSPASRWRMHCGRP